MRWPPVTLTVGILYLSTTSAMRRSSSAVVSPPRCAANHGIGAVLLDVGVAALVDGAALRVVQRLLGPGADEVVVDGRAAGGAAVGRFPPMKANTSSDSSLLARIASRTAWWPWSQAHTGLVLGVAE